MGKKVIFVGWINKGKPADCGETMKNQLCIQKLEEFGIDCMQMDFKNWRKHPWVFVQLVFNILHTGMPHYCCRLLRKTYTR